MSITFLKSRHTLLSAVTYFALVGTSIVYAQSVSTQNVAASSKPSQAAIYTFATATSPASVPMTLSDMACPNGADRQPYTTANPIDPRLAETINSELTRRLSKKMPVTIARGNETITPGTLVFTGCLVTANAGNPAERLVGFDLGSSQLSAHVRVMLQTSTRLAPLQEFDVSVKAGNMLPPLGPAGLLAHGVKERKQTLNADAKKLADQILKKFKENSKKESNSAMNG
jgi:Domain of unknown function (DUF4410)